MKTMKKALALLFAAILTFTLWIPAHALDGSLSVTSIPSARAGATVSVTVSLHNNPGLYSALVEITYDTTALDLVSVTDCGLFGTGEHTMTPSRDIDRFPYRVLWMDNQGALVSASGDLLTITFKVADNAQPGTYDFAVTCESSNTLDANVHAYDLGSANGSVTVVRLPGDADGNGQVTLRDAIMIARYRAGGWGVTIDLSSADVNGDGRITLFDVVLIKRYLVGGWDVVLQ